MKKFLKEVDLKIILLIFFGWKIILFSAYFFAFKFINLFSSNFLGGGLQNYTSYPFIFSWANFDGEHYLSIASIGYRGLEQAFFPVYPILIRLLATPFGNNQIILVIVGLIISNIFFLLSLLMLWKLILLDYKKEIAIWTILTMVAFPTSFYFGSLYNESLFLFLTVTVFYLARKGNFFGATIAGIISTATRIFGLLTLPALLLDLLRDRKFKAKMYWLFLIPSGLLTYMAYQYLTIKDPLAFYHLQKIVGEQHQSGITLLPQVYYRYLKILLTVNMDNPIYQTMVLELITAMAFFLLPIYGFFKKMRWSYISFSLFNFLLPTIQGSFSSLPRYVLVFFPSFLALTLLLDIFPRWFKYSYLLLSGCWLFFETLFFLRGYWVA